MNKIKCEKFYNLALLIISIFLSLTICEISVRYLFYKDLYEPIELIRLYKNGSKSFSSYKKNYKFTGGEIGYIRRTDNTPYNKAGIFGKDIPVKKPKGEFRILVLGDSVTEQATIYKHGFVQTIQNELKFHFKKSNIKVLNSGVGGYNTYQEMLYLKSKGLSTQPDIVLVAFVNNDLSYPIKFIQTKDFIKMVYISPKQIPMFIDFKSYNFLIYSHFKSLCLIFIKAGELLQKNGYTIKKFYNEIPDKNISALKEIRIITKSHGIKMAVVHFPYFQNFSNYEHTKYMKIHKKIRNICKENNIPYLDLLNIYRKYPEKSLYNKNELKTSSIPTHPNDLGHKIAGKAISKFLIKEGIVK